MYMFPDVAWLDYDLMCMIEPDLLSHQNTLLGGGCSLNFLKISSSCSNSYSSHLQNKNNITIPLKDSWVRNNLYIILSIVYDTFKCSINDIIFMIDVI